MSHNNCPIRLKNRIFSFVLINSFLVLSLAFFLPRAIYAQTADKISLQGKIVRNDAGYEGLNVVTGTPSCVQSGADTCDFQVKYYSASTSGTLYLTETFSNVEIGDYDGVFNLSLGSGSFTTTSECDDGTCNTPDEVINDFSTIYIEIGFDPAGGGSFTEVFTRTALNASAYAIKSKYTEYAEGSVADAFKFYNASSVSSTVEGSVYYDTDDDELKLYNGVSWESLATGGGSSLWTEANVGADYGTYMSSAGIGTFSNFTLDTDDDRLSIHSDQMEGGLSVYSSYASVGGTWPLVAFMADNSNYAAAVLELTQDGTGDILQAYSSSTYVLQVDNSGGLHLANNGIEYFEPFSSLPTSGDLDPNTGEGCLYSYGGDIYWDPSCDGNPAALGESLWTDGGTFTYLTSTSDDLVLGASSTASSKFFFDVSEGRLGIGTDSPSAAIDIAGASASISNSSGDITITPADELYINGDVGIGTDSPGYALQVNGVVAPESTDQDLGTSSLRWDLYGNTADFDNTLTMSGSVANIALGSNYLSGDGDDEGIYINSSGHVGVGTSSISYNVDSYGTIGIGNNGSLDFYGGNPMITSIYDDFNFRVNTDTASGGIFHFQHGSDYDESMTITDGAVGIGNGSPSYELDVSGDARVTGILGVGYVPNSDNAITAFGTSYGIGASGTSAGGSFVDTDGTSAAYAAYGTWGFYTGNDAYFGGDVGIGTTSPGAELDVNGDILVGSGNQMTLSSGNINQATGTDLTITAAGTYADIVLKPGNATAMTLDYSGYVGIGDSTPSYVLDVYANATSNYAVGIYNANATASHGLYVNSNAAGSGTNLLNVAANGNSRFLVRGDGYVGIGDSTPSYTLDVSGTARTTGDSRFMGTVSVGTDVGVAGIELYVDGETFLDGDVEMEGNVGIGTSTPSSPLEVVGDAVPIIFGESDSVNYQAQLVSDNSYFGFRDGDGNDRFSISQSSGRIYIGTTGPSARLTVVSSVNERQITAQSTYGENSTLIGFLNVSGTTKGSITGNGSSAVSYNTSSDKRLKENIVVSSLDLDTLMNISVRDFNFIADPTQTYSGFIAQELYNVYPDAVYVGGSNPGQDPWAVDYGRITPLIVAGVQELAETVKGQQTQIDSTTNLLKYIESEELLTIKSSIASTDSNLYDVGTSENRWKDIYTQGSIQLGENGNSGSVRYNTERNTIQFSNDGQTWISLGEATKTITLSAEYSGAVLAGDGTSNSGMMTSDSEGTESKYMNYYEWTSSQTTLQDYDVRVRFTLPEDFAGWTENAIKLSYATESIDPDVAKLDLYLFEQSSETVDTQKLEQVSKEPAKWTNTIIKSSNIEQCAEAGNTCVLVIRGYSSNDHYVRMGDIEITYKRDL